MVIITTGAWQHTEFYVNISAGSKAVADAALAEGYFQGMKLMNSSLLTSFAFKEGLSWLFDFGDKIVTLSVLLLSLIHI